MSKYDEVGKPKEIKKGQLRVWHIPQMPMKAFRVYVKTPKDAKAILNVLAIYDLFQFENKIKPDYSNAQGLEVFENGEWSEWEDNYGFDIDDTEEA
jgi:stage III sporulation protein SpoIIIAA